MASPIEIELAVSSRDLERELELAELQAIAAGARIALKNTLRNLRTTLQIVAQLDDRLQRVERHQKRPTAQGGTAHDREHRNTVRA